MRSPQSTTESLAAGEETLQVPVGASFLQTQVTPQQDAAVARQQCSLTSIPCLPVPRAPTLEKKGK